MMMDQGLMQLLSQGPPTPMPMAMSGNAMSSNMMNSIPPDQMMVLLQMLGDPQMLAMAQQPQGLSSQEAAIAAIMNAGKPGGTMPKGPALRM